MKKICMIIMALGLTYGLASAQIAILPKAGINLSKMALGDNIPESGNIVGINAGVGVNIPFSEDHFLSFQPELLYTQKGYKSNSGNDLKYRFNYIELPVLLKISFGGEMVKGYVNAGPHYSYLTGGQVNGSSLSDDSNDKLIFTDDPSPLNPRQMNANRFELGLDFGGGIGYMMGSSTVLFDVRYTAGLNNVNDEIDSKTKNQVIAFTLGIMVPLSY